MHFMNAPSAFALSLWWATRLSNYRVSNWVARYRSHEVGLDHIFLQALLDGIDQANGFLGTSTSLGLSFEGGRVHSHYEVFDIVVIVREPQSGLEKIFVLQTKRLFPDSWQPSPMAAPIPVMPQIARESIERAWFQLTPNYSGVSKFRSIKTPFPATSIPPLDQASAIDNFDAHFWPVYYLLYAPPAICSRVVRSRDLHGFLRSGGSATLQGILGNLTSFAVEDFLAREVLECREGGPAVARNWSDIEDGVKFVPRTVLTIESGIAEHDTQRRIG